MSSLGPLAEAASLDIWQTNLLSSCDTWKKSAPRTWNRIARCEMKKPSTTPRLCKSIKSSKCELHGSLQSEGSSAAKNILLPVLSTQRSLGTSGRGNGILALHLKYKIRLEFFLYSFTRSAESLRMSLTLNSFRSISPRSRQTATVF